MSDLGVAFRSITKDASDLPAAMIFARFRVLQARSSGGQASGLTFKREYGALNLTSFSMSYSIHTDRQADRHPYIRTYVHIYIYIY